MLSSSDAGHGDDCETCSNSTGGAWSLLIRADLHVPVRARLLLLLRGCAASSLQHLSLGHVHVCMQGAPREPCAQDDTTRALRLRGCLRSDTPERQDPVVSSSSSRPFVLLCPASLHAPSSGSEQGGVTASAVSVHATWVSWAGHTRALRVKTGSWVVPVAGERRCVPQPAFNPLSQGAPPAPPCSDSALVHVPRRQQRQTSHQLLTGYASFFRCAGFATAAQVLDVTSMPDVPPPATLIDALQRVRGTLSCPDAPTAAIDPPSPTAHDAGACECAAPPDEPSCAVRTHDLPPDAAQDWTRLHPAVGVGAESPDVVEDAAAAGPSPAPLPEEPGGEAAPPGPQQQQQLEEGALASAPWWQQRLCFAPQPSPWERVLRGAARAVERLRGSLAGRDAASAAMAECAALPDAFAASALLGVAAVSLLWLALCTALARPSARPAARAVGAPGVGLRAAAPQALADAPAGAPREPPHLHTGLPTPAAPTPPASAVQQLAAVGRSSGRALHDGAAGLVSSARKVLARLSGHAAPTTDAAGAVGGGRWTRDADGRLQRVSGAAWWSADDAALTLATQQDASTTPQRPREPQ